MDNLKGVQLREVVKIGEYRHKLVLVSNLFTILYGCTLKRGMLMKFTYIKAGYLMVIILYVLLCFIFLFLDYTKQAHC